MLVGGRGGEGFGVASWEGGRDVTATGLRGK